jgi:hypothetical protein
MAEYAILIYEDEESMVSLGPAEFDDLIKGHEVFGQKNSAILRGGNALQPPSTATSIRKSPSGGYTVTDGPFGGTRQALAGYYIIDVGDLDEALAVAKQVPAPTGGVEVRSIRVFD